MSWYELYLFVHVTAAVIWVGGGFVLQVLAVLVRRSGDPVRMAGFAGDAEQVGMKLFAPTSLLLFLSALGLMLVDGSPWEWGDPFVSVGLLVWLVSFVAGLVYLGPTAGKVQKEVAANGFDSPRAQQLIASVLRYQRIELVLLFVAVFMMTVKLGT